MDDNDILNKSEVFRNYVNIMLRNEQIEKEAASAEQLKLEEENKKKFKKDTDEIIKKVYDAEDKSQVPQPFVRNLDYDGDDFQAHVKRTFESKKRDENGSYDEFFPDYKVYNKASEEMEIVKNALDEILANPVEVDLSSEESKVEPKVETKEPKAPVAETKPATDNYNTGAGASPYIDVGITNETQKALENGIDYCKPEKACPKKTEAPKDEIQEAEKALGLDKNIYYILSKMAK